MLSLKFNTGISDIERKRRICSNKLSTKINFVAWIIQVSIGYENIEKLFWTIKIIKSLFFVPILLSSNYLIYVIFLSPHLQVFGLLVLILPSPLPMSLRYLSWIVINLNGPPLFYIVASEFQNWKIPTYCKISPCVRPVHSVVV